MEVLRNPADELRDTWSSRFPLSKKSRGFTAFYGREQKKMKAALDYLGFRLPNKQECVYIYKFLKDLKHFERKKFWVETEKGAQILLMYGNGYIGSGLEENEPYILFAVRDLPSS